MTDAAAKTTRAEDVATSRRDRFEATANDLSLRRFGVADKILDMERFVYRAAVDTGTRLLQLTKNDDYDFVTDAGEATGDPSKEGVLRYRSGTVDGAPQFTYLLRKPKKFADEHRKRSLDKLDVEQKARLTEVPADARQGGYKPG